MAERVPAPPAGHRRRVGRELAEALRAGTFEQALRLAIRARGLTLERIRVRLLERGVDTSLASLSNWQRGRCRPERARSLQAVRELEDILGLDPDSLVTLLGPRRPRGRWLRAASGSVNDQVRVRLIVETAGGVRIFERELPPASLLAARDDQP